MFIYIKVLYLIIVNNMYLYIKNQDYTLLLRYENVYKCINQLYKYIQ